MIATIAGMSPVDFEVMPVLSGCQDPFHVAGRSGVRSRELPRELSGAQTCRGRSIETLKIQLEVLLDDLEVEKEIL